MINVDYSLKNYQTTDEVRIENSTYCNHNCNFCPYGTDLFVRENQIMTNELFESLVLKIKEESPQINKMTISGLGEPFIDKNIYDKLKFSKNLGFTTIILSNGTVVDVNKFDENDLDILRISLHSLDKEKFYKITGGNLENLLKNIDFFNKTKVKICLTCVVEEKDENDINEIIEKFSSTVDVIEIWKPHNWANLFKYRNSQKITNTCGRPFSGPLQIDVDGDVKLCCFDTNGELYIGNLKLESLESMYNSDRYKEIVKAHKSGNLEGLVCNACDQIMDKKDVLIYSTQNSEDRLNLTSSTFSKFV